MVAGDPAAGTTTPFFKFMNLTNPTPDSKRPPACFVTIVFPALALLLVTSCGPRASSTEISTSPAATKPATVEERVEIITKQLSRKGKLPGVLLDAQFLEEKVGDGVLGPSDFQAFYALTVPVADVLAWRAALAGSPLVNGSGGYAAPKAATPWWVSEADYRKLELFGPKSLNGRFNGWVGLGSDGRIFIYAFTM